MLRWSFVSAFLLTLTQSDVQHAKRFSCSGVECSSAPACMDCVWPSSCAIGEQVKVSCSSRVGCAYPQTLQFTTTCMYCWQRDPCDYTCTSPTNCSTATAEYHTTKCRVHSDVVCMGHREFLKNVRCNWSSGYSWARAFMLSITLGGFGVDRFYLGLWKSAIGKLFSFGGLGVWTIVDAILIALGYIRPSDASHYS